MGYTVRLQAFEGPLDLLLQLVEAEKLAISEISLAQVTEPFVQAIRERAQDERYPLEDLAHFLVIAAKLVALKARLLIPTPTDTEEELSLIERLRAYQAFVSAGEWLRQRGEGGALLFPRGPHEEVLEGVLPSVPPLQRLADLVRAALKRQETPLPPPRAAIMQRLVTLEERMASLREVVTRGERISFAAWIGTDTSREVTVVSFLALLELLKAGTVTVTQQALFADLTISGV